MSLALLLGACEMKFEIKDVDGEDRIYIECTASTLSDVSEITVVGVRSINKPAQDYRTPAGLQVRMTIDGKEVDIIPSETNVNEERFIYEGAVEPGQKIRIDASADGYASAYAETKVPYPVEDFDVRLEELGQEHYRLVLEYPDDPKTTDMYGAFFMTRKVRESADGTVSLYESEQYGRFVHESDDFDVSTMRFMDYDGVEMAVWNDSRAVSGGRQSVEFQIKRNNDYEHNISNYFGEDKAMMRPQYRLLLLKLSPEYYRYLNGQWDSNNNILSWVGLSAATFTYTNVIGGLGVLGSFTASPSEWLYNIY